MHTGGCTYLDCVSRVYLNRNSATAGAAEAAAVQISLLHKPWQRCMGQAQLPVLLSAKRCTSMQKHLCYLRQFCDRLAQLLWPLYENARSKTVRQVSLQHMHCFSRLSTQRSSKTPSKIMTEFSVIAIDLSTSLS